MKTNQKIRDFFGNKKYVYATPGTGNHSSNFYGFTRIIKLSRTDIQQAAECLLSSACDVDDIDEAIDIVLDDMQYERPTD